jgi:hypothetical protein
LALEDEAGVIRAGEPGKTGRVSESFVDLLWIPVAAGTPRAQQMSLALWEAIMAAASRRRRATLYHPAMKVGLDGVTYTMELTPVFVGEPSVPAMTGPVGFRGADRFRFFRYQLRCFEADMLPDEEWAPGPPIRLAGNRDLAQRMLDLAPAVPPYVWGRRVNGTSEMWTSASVVSWMLMQAGIDARSIAIPEGGRAPGWDAGIEVAERVSSGMWR